VTKVCVIVTSLSGVFKGSHISGKVRSPFLICLSWCNAHCCDWCTRLSFWGCVMYQNTWGNRPGSVIQSLGVAGGVTWRPKIWIWWADST
jgi:hypothetical protein